MSLNYEKDPKEFFNYYHNKYSNENDLINPDWELYHTKYHYNMVENGIVDFLRGLYSEDILNKYVLDIGLGTGHWVDFYLEFLKANVTAVDFSDIVIKRAKEKYLSVPNVDVLQLDISDRVGAFHEQYNVINAIGVMFHLVDDDLWQAAVENLCFYLKPGGSLIVGGDFTETKRISHHRKVRSLGVWKAMVSSCGCAVQDVTYFDWFKGTTAGQLRNNLLLVRKK